MSSFHAFAFGALVVAVCALGLNAARPAVAQTTGPYQLMRHSNPTAAAGVFRVDTSTGGVSYCYISSGNELLCSREVK